MSQSVTTPPQLVPIPAASPTWFDFLLVLVGIAVSQVLANLAELKVQLTDVSPSWMTVPVAQSLPYLLFLPAGVILWWPIFFATGRFRGRSRDLTMAEYVWGFVWLLDLAFVSCVIWYHHAGLPSAIDDKTLTNVLTFARYTVFALAVIALVLGVGTMLLRAPAPWTHHMGIALLGWPAVVWLLIWLGRVEITL